MPETLAELVEYLADNPRLRDNLLRELTGADLATARAATSVAETMSQPAWAETVKTSMTLSGRVSRYREARLSSDSQRALSVIAPPLQEGEACQNCDEPATVKRLTALAWYGFCFTHDPQGENDFNYCGDCGQSPCRA